MIKDNLSKEIGAWLAEQRNEKQMTQAEVGKKLGVTKTGIHYWETGKRDISADMLLKYCEAVDADLMLFIEIQKKKRVR